MAFNDERQILGTVSINGIRTPGIATVAPPKEEVNYENSQGFALSGPVSRFSGVPVKKGSVRFVMDRDGYVFWMDKIHPILRAPAKGKRPSKISVVHPYLAVQRLSVVATTAITGPFWDTKDVKGAYVVDWEFQQHAPADPLPSRLIDPLRPFEGQEGAETETQKELKRIQEENTKLQNFLDR